MKKFLKSDCAISIAFVFCVVGMIGITIACRTNIENIDMTALVSWWCMAMAGTIMITFGKEF